VCTASAPSIVLDLLPVDADNLDTGVIPENSCTTTLRFDIQDCPVGGESDVSARARQQWMLAFERCFQFTLRSLSFPSHSGSHVVHGPNVDLELDTERSMLSILASGLPFPKSPSVQLDELVNPNPNPNEGSIRDAKRLEREERGWWSLRFQQVLREMQRQDWTLMSGFHDAALVPLT
jgi:hypothetical protein